MFIKAYFVDEQLTQRTSVPMESSSVRMENVLTISWCATKNMTVKTSRMKTNAVSTGSTSSKILSVRKH